jgi:hypothetical protein
MRNLGIFILLLIHRLDAHSIVFIHIGSKLPSHVSVSIEQARLFNEECPIFLIANRKAVKDKNFLKKYKVTFVSCESLQPSSAHARFQNNPKQDWGFKGLWVYSSERFFFLEELIRKYQLTDVFHLESDVMLYVDLNELLPIFAKRYSGMIGAIFENDHRCVPSFLYVSNLIPIEKLIDFYPKTVHMLQSDMETLADFKERYHKIFIDHLPIIFSEYAEDYPLQVNSIPSKEPGCYSNYIDEFGVIFDGAAWGIYLAGWDSRWHSAIEGTITPYCVFNASFLHLDWNVDNKGRRVPLITYKNKRLPVANLHITNKSKINYFKSRT